MAATILLYVIIRNGYIKYKGVDHSKGYSNTDDEQKTANKRFVVRVGR
jgi:hypothetical protein